jgi:propanol-preferring alcohol dehydrogenase
VLCAGVTVYKGLKITDAKPGDWVVISGIGGLGHMAVQYAKAMGFNVAAVDIDDSKLALARKLGATVTVNAKNTDPAAYLQRRSRAHGVLVTAVSPKAFEQALGMVRRGGTISLNGLPPGDFRCRSSPWCSRASRCAAPSSARAWTCRSRWTLPPRARSRPRSTDKLENINDIFARMHEGQIEGRVVLDIAA